MTICSGYCKKCGAYVSTTLKDVKVVVTDGKREIIKCPFCREQEKKMKNVKR